MTAIDRTRLKTLQKREDSRFLLLYAFNRGVLLTPFHNLALMSPATTEADIDTHTKIFASAVHELIS